jgi:hypothetical protein
MSNAWNLKEEMKKESNLTNNAIWFDLAMKGIR